MTFLWSHSNVGADRPANEHSSHPFVADGEFGTFVAPDSVHAKPETTVELRCLKGLSRNYQRAAAAQEVSATPWSWIKLLDSGLPITYMPREHRGRRWTASASFVFEPHSRPGSSGRHCHKAHATNYHLSIRRPANQDTVDETWWTWIGPPRRPGM